MIYDRSKISASVVGHSSSFASWILNGLEFAKYFSQTFLPPRTIFRLKTGNSKFLPWPIVTPFSSNISRISVAINKKMLGWDVLVIPIFFCQIECSQICYLVKRHNFWSDYLKMVLNVLKFLSYPDILGANIQKQEMNQTTRRNDLMDV